MSKDEVLVERLIKDVKKYVIHDDYNRFAMLLIFAEGIESELFQLGFSTQTLEKTISNLLQVKSINGNPLDLIELEAKTLSQTLESRPGNKDEFVRELAFQMFGFVTRIGTDELIPTTAALGEVWSKGVVQQIIKDVDFFGRGV